MFSVIIPLYNKELELKKTVESVVTAFSKHKHEIVIVNDGSTDNSLQIANELRNSFDHVNIITQKNGGVSLSRNAGIINSKFRYLVFLDADDILLPHTGDEYYNLIESNKKCGMFCVGYEIQHKTHSVGFNSKRHLGHENWFGIVDNPLKVISQDKNSIFMCASSICVDKLILEKFDISFPVGVTHTEDAAFFYDLMIKSKVAYSSKVCSIYKMEASNRSNLNKPTKTRYVVDKVKSEIECGTLTEEQKFWSKSYIAKNYVHTAFNCIEMDSKEDFSLMKSMISQNIKYMSNYYKVIAIAFCAIPFNILRSCLSK
ncbi:glycosyltransferase family 2 protein [Vibrio owensii]|uniref:glycosyltransferase family 2 protein n=1 Tax=Vibrio owensii TaxID=696485 RepID=UPI003DA0BE66